MGTLLASMYWAITGWVFSPSKMHFLHLFVNPSMNIFLSRNLFLQRVIDWFHSEIKPIRTLSSASKNFSAIAFTSRVHSTMD